MKKYLVISFLLTLFILAACGGKTEATQTPETAAVTVTNPDQVIQVKAGEEFTITVESHPNTTLHWEVAVQLDTTVVDYVRKVFKAKSGSSDSAGWDIWTFKAIAPGETTITLGYYRGETEDADKMAIFKIIVI